MRVPGPGRLSVKIEPFAAIAAMLWGSSYPATQIALRGFSPFAVAFWRTSVGLVFLAVVSFIGSDKPIQLGHLRLAHWWRLAVLAVLSTSGFVALLNFAIQYAGPVMAAFIVSTYPAVTLLFAPMVLGERAAARTTAGALVSIAGAFLLLGVSQTLGRRAAADALTGGLLALGASLCF
ncbi:MAG: DMT family transporter, partial [Chloroflexota bacterium]|nr:DMT family transporter [Chloroflexota bacterium]